MKRAITLFLLLVSLTASGGTRQVRFNKNKEFKIVHLTDLHFVSTRPEEVAKTFARMDYIVGEEHPDFIAITGDVLFGSPARRMLEDIVARLDSYETPWCLVYGNHDAEQDMSRAEMSEIVTSGKYNMNTLNGAGELADVRIPVGGSDANSHPLDLYMLDSHDYSKNPAVGGYAWFNKEQIDWVRSSCLEATAGNGGQHVPSFAFFHIPFPEFYDAWMLAEGKSRNGAVGLRGEFGGHPKINSGMFAAMLETGNIIGVFCGHDHDSDYIVPYYGIALAYARYSGDDTVYNHLAHGTRVILVKEGESAFRTWIHEDDGRIQYDVRFDNGEVKYQ